MNSNLAYMIHTAQRIAAQRNRAARDPVQPDIPPVPPLVDQVRDYLATLPAAQKRRLSIPLIIPHLKGKYREHPHLLHVARALRQLGYTPMRSWVQEDHARRYWVAPEGK